MNKLGLKTRDFQWYSHKNGGMVRVKSKHARDYAKWLEEEPEVESFEANKPLELSRFPHISPTGIRKLYFQTAWCSDFYIKFMDGRNSVRELVSADGLHQQAIVERLELSRRYWSAMGVEWKVVLTP